MQQESHPPVYSGGGYRLEIGRGTLLLLVLLFSFTAVVVFYLGVATGKATRQANPLQAVTSSDSPSDRKSDKKLDKKPDKKPVAVGTLAFNRALKPNQESIEPLFAEREASSNRTRQLLQHARQLLGEPIPPAEPVSSAPAANSRASTAKQQLYTLQVFASTSRPAAEKLAKKLRQQSYHAYLSQSDINNRTWHRVRIGKLPKQQIEKIAQKLPQYTSQILKLR